MKLLFACAAATLLVSAALFAGEKEETGVQVGDKAPDFKLKGSDGKEYRLSDFRGKQWVVIAWFPKADTPG